MSVLEMLGLILFFAFGYWLGYLARLFTNACDNVKSIKEIISKGSHWRR
jgi:hypothetical protein